MGADCATRCWRFSLKPEAPGITIGVMCCCRTHLIDHGRDMSSDATCHQVGHQLLHLLAHTVLDLCRQ